ncbi:ABC transporter permease [Actinomycetospora aeridis]|uniref:ABC transporter permease n=1 Tax=Actinomycetospora aeridis TaxID=3129231 RepID=A0ABU8NBP6_9PSEU
MTTVAPRPTGDPRLVPRPRTRRGLAPGRTTARGLLLGPALLVLIWVLGSATGLIDPATLSPPWTVVSTFGDLIADGRLQSNLLSSVQRAALGLLLGIVAGLALALLAGLSRAGEAVVDGPVQIKRAVPTLALIPLMIVWFGIGEEMKVVVIALSVFVPIYINTHAALRGVDARWVELAESVELSRTSFVRRVAVPGALPGFFTGLRLAVTIAWTALVVVEQVNATSGIGYLMTQARNYGQTEIIVAGLVVYAVLGLAGDTTVRAIERRALSWRRTLGS